MILALFGRLHMPLVHFPIVLLFVALALEVVIARRLEAQKRQELALLLLTVTAALSVVTAVAGLAHAQHEDFSGASWNSFQLHRAGGILVAALAVLLLLLRKGSTTPKPAYTPLLVASVIAVSATGHFGGNLVHGEGFYTRALREEGDGGKAGGDDQNVFSYDDSDGSGGARQRQPEGNVPDKPDYAKDIKPIFDRSCVKCHGPEKRKSGLRLDEKRFAMKGGETGPVAIVPGDADKSLVYTMVAKSADDEDVMPPKGKLLSLSEIETIKRWIEQGADWPEK